ncbi:MAG TPA: hypothetical protein VFH47_09120 [Candidatus Thermoplasmatota archaeon]|nr:hypothetical protein [Candidatus Thermoplasmatota archaeon]HET6399698.1 hypothetical protein [Candidatus Thermoplasmatota archaeon]
MLAGLAAWRVPVAGPVLDERYTVEGAGPGDDEWDMAAGEAGTDDPGTPLR